MRAEKEYLISMAFDSNKSQYIIPVYQRNYEWTKPNCLELFNDVIAAFDNEKSHFFGTFVQCINQELQTNGMKNCVVIDGQQRLTTIYLILIALYDISVKMGASDADGIRELLFNESKLIDLPQEQRYRIKLKATKTDMEQLTKLLFGKKDEMDKSSNIYINYQYFVELIEKKIKEGYRISNIKSGLEKLEIVAISLKEPDDDPQEIFDRINSTGVDLKLSDSVRNLLLMTNPNMDQLHDKYWLPMEESIGSENLDHYLSSFLAYKLIDVNDRTAYDAFKKYVNSEEQTREDLIKEISEYSKYYCAFIGRGNGYSIKTRKLLSCFRQLNQTTIYPFLLPIFKDHENGIIDDEVLEKILSFFLNYIIRRAATDTPTNSLRGLFRTLYKRVFNQNEGVNSEEYLNCIYKTMASLTGTRDVVPSDEEFRNALINTKLYRNRNLCRLLLLTLEQTGGQKNELIQDSDDITIEHIMPQTLDDWWIKHLGANYNEIHEKYVHVLGNMSLTGINSELSNAPFDVKKEQYKKSRYSFLYSSVLPYEEWNDIAIQERSELLADRLLEIFKLPESFKRQDIADLRRSSEMFFTIQDDFDYSKTFPISYTFLGVEHCVESKHYIDLVISVLEMVAELHPQEFVEFCRNNQIVTSTGAPVLTYTEESLRQPRQIGNTSIYFEANSSTAQKMMHLRKILIAFDLADDLTFIVANVEN